MNHNITNTNIEFRKAELSEVEQIWSIINQAKAQMKRLGSKQWADDYPLYQTVINDINKNEGFVFHIDNTILAYGVISYLGEPVYNQIKKSWNNDLPYLTVHRLAVADIAKRQGLGLRFMQEAENNARNLGITNFRVDTNFDNHYMLRIIEKMGFKYVGDVIYRETQTRKAFEKTIQPHYHDFNCSGFTLREVIFDDSIPIFNGIEKHRQDMRVWLPFVDDLKTLEDQTTFIHSILATPYSSRKLIFAIETNGILCGLIGYSNIDNNALEIGYWLFPNFRGNGIMIKATKYLCEWTFMNKNIKTIYIKCSTDNINSNNIPQRLGFKLENVIKNGQLLVDNKYTDLNVYSLTKN